MKYSFADRDVGQDDDKDRAIFGVPGLKIFYAPETWNGLL